MRILSCSESQALAALKVLGLRVPFLGTMSVTNGVKQALICDYTQMPGYAIRYAISILDRDGNMTARFNVL